MISLSADAVTVVIMATHFAVPDAHGANPFTLRTDISQQAVLELGEGESAVVLGAPGTGKTTTIIEAMAERVHQRGYAPGEVLAFAASRTAATTLRDRIALRLDGATPGPLARTVASWAFQLLGDRARRVGHESPKLLTGAEQDQIMADLLAASADSDSGSLWPPELGPQARSLRGFRSELRELSARLNERGLSPDDLYRLGASSNHPQWQAAARFFSEYHSVLDGYRPGSIDATELVVSAAVALDRGADFGGLRVVFVDDVQEATRGALELFRALASRGVAIVACGDPDVATTTFRGAQTTALGRFDTWLGVPVNRFVLATAHRHTPELREMVSRVTSRIGTAAAGLQRVAVPGRASQKGEQGSITPREVSSAGEHTAALARILREEHLLNGVPFSDMVVIVRSGEQIPWLARGLAMSDVPTITSAGRAALRDENAARELSTLVGVVLDVLPLNSDTATQLLCGPFGGLDSVGLRRLRLALRHEELAAGGSRSADELLVESLDAPHRLISIDFSHGRRARRLAETLSRARALAAEGGTIEELLWLCWERSNRAETWGSQSEGIGIVADEANRHLDGIVALFAAARRFVERFPGRPNSDFINDVLVTEVPEDTLAARNASDAVLVCTPSATVGREFAIVAVAGLQEAVWPNLRPRSSLLHADEIDPVREGYSAQDENARAEVLNDELRMFALAISRARERLVLLSTSNDDEQPSPFLRLAPRETAETGTVTRHPLTLRGIVGTLRRELVVSGSSAAAAGLARLAAQGVEGADPDEWYGLTEPSTTEPLTELNAPDAHVRVSPSKLATFEKSPLAWFIDSVASSAGGAASAIGTLVHAVMDQAGRTGDWNPATLWADIEQHWGELHWESSWIEEREKRRARALVTGVSDYLEDFNGAGGRLLDSEGSFQLRLGPALLVGTIDRLELTIEGTVVIVDLKTGKTVPSKAEVATHAQLGSYQLALETGVIEQAGARPSGGAKLVFVSQGVNGRAYKEVRQLPMGADESDAMRDRVVHAAEGMAAARFLAVISREEYDPHSAYRYRLHVIPAVCE